MAAAINQNIQLAVGEDRVITFTVVDSAGVAVSIAASTQTWRVSAHEHSAVNVLQLTGALVGGGTGGQFSVTIADTDTDALNPGVYYHEAKVTAGSGAETVVAWGTVDLRPARVANPV